MSQAVATTRGKLAGLVVGTALATGAATGAVTTCEPSAARPPAGELIYSHDGGLLCEYANEAPLHEAANVLGTTYIRWAPPAGLEPSEVAQVEFWVDGQFNRADSTPCPYEVHPPPSFDSQPHQVLAKITLTDQTVRAAAAEFNKDPDGTVTTTTDAPTTSSSTSSTSSPPPPPTSTSTVPPTSGEAPTYQSTGPELPLTGTMTAAEFVASRTCDRRQVVGSVTVEDIDSPTTWNVSNCVFNDFLLVKGGDTTAAQTWNITSSRFNQAFIFNDPVRGTWRDISVGDGLGSTDETQLAHAWNGTRAQWDLRIEDSFFWSNTNPCPPGSGCHVDTIQWGYSEAGIDLYRNTLMMSGPHQNSTGNLNFYGCDSQIIGNWFLWGNPAAPSAYFSVYINTAPCGDDTFFDQNRIDRGPGGAYFYTSPSNRYPRWGVNYDARTGAEIQEPS